MKVKIYNIMAVSMLLSLAACSNSEDWTPGPADNEAGVRAYFNNPTKTSFVFEADAPSSEQTIDVKVSRFVTDNAISIPLELTSETEGFSLLGNADFEAGQSETSVTVSCAGIPAGKQAAFTLSVPENQFYTYGEGLPSVSFSAIKASWIECADNVTYIYQYLSGEEMYPDTKGRMYQLEGTFQFRLTDFFGSGLDMEFICNTPNSTMFSPLMNCDFENAAGGDYAGMQCWYLFDDENQTWPEWTPGNAEGYPAVAYVVFWGDTSYSTLKMIDNASTLYGYMDLSTDVTFDDDSFEWGVWYVTYNLKYNPYE